MFEVDEAAKVISSAADPDANIIFGAVVKDDLIDQVRITVIATGFDQTRSRIAQMAKTTKHPVVEGVVSEKPKEDEEMDVSGEESPLQDVNEDVFGEKFEIPAFLRKIH